MSAIDWPLVALAITGPPSAAWALSKLWVWNGTGIGE